MDKYDSPSRQIVESMEIMQSVLMGDPVEPEMVSLLDEKMRKIVLFESNVEVASLFAKALAGILLCHPGSERKGDAYIKMVKEHYLAVKEKMDNLSTRAREVMDGYRG